MEELPRSEDTALEKTGLCSGCNADAARDGGDVEFWNSIDGIVVINLDSRPDRWKKFCEGIASFLPPGKVHRISGVDGKDLPGYGVEPWFRASTGNRAPIWGGIAGCTLAHRKSLEYARQQGWNTFLVLEDDACLQDTGGPAYALLNRLLPSLGAKPYVLYLGFNRPAPFGRRVMREADYAAWIVDGVLTTHSYITNAAMRDKLLQMLPEEHNVWEWLSRYRAVDAFYRDFVSALPGVGVYAIYPMLFRQTLSFSNVMQKEYEAGTFDCDTPPISYCSLKGALHLLGLPFRRLVKWLNSVRRHWRAMRKGLPGYHKPKKK